MKRYRHAWHPLTILLIIILTSMSRLASAEWVALESRYQLPGLQTFYADPDTIRREGQFVTLWQLTDFLWAQGGPGFSFRSSKTQKQFDCGAPRVRFLTFAEFSGAMGMGARMYGLVDPNNWLSIDKGTNLNQALWDLACGNS